MTAPSGNDLFVLVADNDMKLAMTALLARPRTLGVACFGFDVERYIGRDPGCRRDAANILRPRSKKYDHCLVMFDYHGCGSMEPREEIQQQGEKELMRNGWNRAKVIVVQPELEAWVWGDLATASHVFGWSGNHRALRESLTQWGLWPDGQSKPPDPKKAMKKAIRRGRGRLRQRPDMFQRTAQTANVDACRDPAFQELLATLRRWFPPNNTPT